MSKNPFLPYELDALERNGLTPEEARDITVEKLRKANLPEKDIEEFTKPIDELTSSSAHEIMHFAVYRPNEPEHWIKFRGEDFSNISSYLQCLHYMMS